MHNYVGNLSHDMIFPLYFIGTILYFPVYLSTKISIVCNVYTVQVADRYNVLFLLNSSLSPSYLLSSSSFISYEIKKSTIKEGNRASLKKIIRAFDPRPFLLSTAFSFIVYLSFLYLYSNKSFHQFVMVLLPHCFCQGTLLVWIPLLAQRWRDLCVLFLLSLLCFRTLSSSPASC